MKFYPSEESFTDENVLAQDYSAAREIGKVSLGQSFLFYRKNFKTYYLNYSSLRRAYRRVESVPAKMCCASGEFTLEKIVIHNSKDQEVSVIDLPDTRAGIILLEEIGKRSPETVLSCPQKKTGKKDVV